MISAVRASIVIPTMLSREVKLRRAIASIQYSPNEFEVVVAAQRSVFSSFDIKSEFPDVAIKMVVNDGEGTAASNRNMAIQQASGEYVAFLDDDDEFLPGKLEIQIAAMEKAGASWSFSNYFLVDEKLDNKSRYLSTRTMLRRSLDFDRNCAIATPTVMVRRDFLENNGLLFNCDLLIREDIDMWSKFLALAPGLYIPQALSVVNRSVSSSFQGSQNLRLVSILARKAPQSVLNARRRLFDWADEARGVTHLISFR